MINLLLVLFTIIILVTQNVILLNEESLILLCFVVFVLLSLNKLNNSVNSSFQTQSLQLAESFQTSFKKIYRLVYQFIDLKYSLNHLLKKF